MIDMINTVENLFQIVFQYQLQEWKSSSEVIVKDFVMFDMKVMVESISSIK